MRRFMSLWSQSTEDRQNGVNAGVASTQSTRLALFSPLSRLSTFSPDLLAGGLKTSTESPSLQKKLAECFKANAQLSLEVARLHEQLANVGNPLAHIVGSSVDFDNSPKFTRFPNLPIEIRLIIWELVAHQPRVVEVRTVPRKDGRTNLDHGQKFKFMNHTPPAMLHVNRESRKEGRSHYRLTILNDWQHKTYFNAKSDVLYLGFCPCEGLAYDDSWAYYAGRGGETFSKIAIRSDVFNNLNHGGHMFAHVISLFAKHGVREILLVDETFTKDSVKKTDHLSPLNLNRNLNLTRVSLQDNLKNKVTGRPNDGWYASLQSVSEFIGSIETSIQTGFNDAKNGNEWDGEDMMHHLQNIDEYKPTLTMMRLKFAEANYKEVEEDDKVEEFKYEGGKRQINWL